MLVTVVFDWKRLYIFIQGSVDMQGFFNLQETWLRMKVEDG